MTENRTSQAIEALLKPGTDGYVIHPILAKYKRMEETLTRIAESKVPDDESADPETRRFIYAGDMLGMRVVAKKALSFDPLDQ